MTLTGFFLAVLAAQPVAADRVRPHPNDPLIAAAHASALCDCPQPLADYLSYQLQPAVPQAAPGATASGGSEHITIMQLINERWGRRYDLGGFDTTAFDADYLDRWHLWIEAVQVAHGMPPSYVHTPGGRDTKPASRPVAANRDIGPVNTNITLNCSNCDDAHCDALRLAVAAQQAIYDGDYDQQCIDGCSNSRDEMRTRFVEALFEGGPGRTGGWNFKIVARQAEPALQLVHAKLVPVWGEEYLFDFSIFGFGIDGSVNLLSVMHAYQVHILKPDGQWVYWQWDVNQPRLSRVPPYSPYPQCHALYSPPQSIGGSDPCAGFNTQPLR